jgi:PTS system nitrogen regulatory IIA component
MEIRDILTEACVVTALKATSKKQALNEMARLAAEKTGLQEYTIFDILLERERLGTTGVGDGIAIPHGKLPDLKNLYACFARLETPVHFEAIDSAPVDLVFLLLAPESAGADHLQALARISRIMRNRNHCEKLRTAPTSKKIYALLTADQKSKAA